MKLFTLWCDRGTIRGPFFFLSLPLFSSFFLSPLLSSSFFPSLPLFFFFFFSFSSSFSFFLLLFSYPFFPLFLPHSFSFFPSFSFFFFFSFLFLFFLPFLSVGLYVTHSLLHVIFSSDRSLLLFFLASRDSGVLTQTVRCLLLCFGHKEAHLVEQEQYLVNLLLRGLLFILNFSSDGIPHLKIHTRAHMHTLCYLELNFLYTIYQ